MAIKYYMLPPDYYTVIRCLDSKITHLDNLDIGLPAAFSQCGNYSKKWTEVGLLKETEVTCKVCLKQLRNMGIFPKKAIDG